MARSWERMVQKNRKQLNKKRKDQGLSSISSTGSGSKVSGDIFKGRKMLLPFTLVVLSLLYGLLGVYAEQLVENNEQSSVVNWIVIGLYILLAVIIYLRRPYLRVDKDSLYTTRMNRETRIGAVNIAKISLKSGSVVITPLKGKGRNWVFTRLINRYDTEAMGERLEIFAETHKIPLEK
ncbi:hypothetical protein J2T13_002023 [Paenibacillus sp. DS2015]|uniref:hypothetical protein n=1 Tax=Paenibacillus sp. DS2015 TaxID=3373917 RepID=UPI003D19E722